MKSKNPAAPVRLANVLPEPTVYTPEIIGLILNPKGVG